MSAWARPVDFPPGYVGGDVDAAVGGALDGFEEVVGFVGGAENGAEGGDIGWGCFAEYKAVVGVGEGDGRVERRRGIVVEWITEITGM